MRDSLLTVQFFGIAENTNNIVWYGNSQYIGGMARLNKE